MPHHICQSQVNNALVHQYASHLRRLVCLFLLEICSWLAFRVLDLYICSLLLIFFFGLTWRHIRVPHHNIIRFKSGEVPVWTGSMLSRCFSHILLWSPACLETIAGQKCEALSTAVCDLQTWVWFFYWLLMSLVPCCYLSIVNNNCEKKICRKHIMIVMLASTKMAGSVFQILNSWKLICTSFSWEIANAG